MTYFEKCGASNTTFPSPSTAPFMSSATLLSSTCSTAAFSLDVISGGVYADLYRSGWLYFGTVYQEFDIVGEDILDGKLFFDRFFLLLLFRFPFTSSSEVISVTESCASAGRASADPFTLTVAFPTCTDHSFFRKGIFRCQVYQTHLR